MHPLLKKYIETKEAEKQKALEEEKNEFLLTEGLCERFYYKEHPGNECLNWDSENEQYYRMVPIQISNSEYEELKKYCNPPKATNTIATILKVMAWCELIAGVLIGIILLAEESVIALILSWGASFTTFIFTLALAEIIARLHSIKNK